MNTARLNCLFLMLVLTLTGCVNISTKVLRPAILPQPNAQDTSMAKTNWLIHELGFPGIQRLTTDLKSWDKAKLNDFQTKTRTIALNNGQSNHIVTIEYEDFGSADSLEGGSVIKKITVLGSSILHSDKPSSANISKCDLKEILNLISQLSSFQGTNFQTSLSTHINQLVASQLDGLTNSATNLTIKVSLDAMLATYLKFYLNGAYIDRWGTAVSQPDIAKIGNDTVSPLTKVVLEAVFDYSLMTPIIHDSGQPGTTNTPTFAVVFPQLYEPISTNSDASGITEAKYSLIKDFSKSGGEINNLLSSLLIKAFGGVSVGGKVSFGDNSTLSAILSTLCAELSSRTTEEISYDFLEKFRYIGSTNSVLQPDYAANTNNMFKMDYPLQYAVCLMLANQSSLNTLMQNGWKLSGTNLSAYANIAGNVVSTETGNPPLKIDGNLYGAAQAITENKGNLSSAQQQALIGTFSQLVQSFETNSATSPQTH